ncbi:MAG: VTC domain-containing protein [Nitratireductor sp.]|nr:VTC domain-containing protein [Nitratireductor sp.]
MSYRVEHKFRLTHAEALQMRSELIAQGMAPLFPARRIESIYFDNRVFGMFVDSEEGSLPRKKIRLRHYPEAGSACSLEIKVSSIEGRFKTTRELIADEARAMLETGITDPQYGLCKPCLVIAYDREYFEHRGVRVTFDSDIRYSRYNSATVRREFECVAEIKAPIDTPQDLLADLIPGGRARFSKYGRAASRLLLAA